MITEREDGALFNKFFYIIIHCAYYHKEDYELLRIMLFKGF